MKAAGKGVRMEGRRRTGRVQICRGTHLTAVYPALLSVICRLKASFGLLSLFCRYLSIVITDISSLLFFEPYIDLAFANSFALFSAMNCFPSMQLFHNSVSVESDKAVISTDAEAEAEAEAHFRLTASAFLLISDND